MQALFRVFPSFSIGRKPVFVYFLGFLFEARLFSCMLYAVACDPVFSCAGVFSSS